MVPKLTVDGGLLREAAPSSAVSMLREWASLGKIELFETDRIQASSSNPGWPGGSPPPRSRRNSRSGKMESKGNATFQAISNILFPFRDAHRLNMAEINDVAHLIRHHLLGHSIFVTQNHQTFIAGGKQQRLQETLKILVLSPEDAVISLQSRIARAAGDT